MEASSRASHADVGTSTAVLRAGSITSGEQVASLQVQELKHEVQGVKHDLQKYDRNVDDSIWQLNRQVREASWEQNQDNGRIQRDELRLPTRRDSVSDHFRTPGRASGAGGWPQQSLP